LATDGPTAGFMNIGSGASSSMAGRSSSEAPTYTFFSMNKGAFSGQAAVLNKQGNAAYKADPYLYKSKVHL